MSISDSYPDGSHHELGEAGLNGRRELTVLWMQACPLVAAFIRSVVRDRHDADDLLQKVALVVTDKIEVYDGERPFSAWAMGIARYEVAAYFRSKQRDRHCFGEDLITQIADRCVSMGEQYNPKSEALAVCMKRLGGRGFKILEMRYLRDLEVGQIAERIGSSPNAVRIVLHRVRQQLAECIEQRMVSQRGKAS